MKETGWTGSLHGWLVDTIRGGRLTPTRPEYVGNTPQGGMAMPFWSQDFGGPLRNDQIEDIAYYLENMPAEPVEEAGGPTPTPLAIDPADTDAIIDAGVAVYQQNACIGCHTLSIAGAAGVTGPTHEEMGAVAEERIADPNYNGAATTAEEYIRESIVDPAAFVVPDYPPAMPPFTEIPEDQLDVLVQMLLLQQ
jgi:hypothetical protein